MIWNQLTSIDQIKEIDAESAHRKVIILKHSTRCSISTSVLNRLESNWKESDQNKLKPYYLDLLIHRDISNKLATHYNVEHESPQVLVIEKGKCIYTESHHGIRYEDLPEVGQKTTI